MKKLLLFIVVFCSSVMVSISPVAARTATCNRQVDTRSRFVRVEGKNLIKPNGEKLLIKGTNLSFWLNPEGYMFGFKDTNSTERINTMLCELVGPVYTSKFWKLFKDNFITRDDIRFIAANNANTIRVPMNYRLFTDDDYMGLTKDGDGFARIDSLVGWCRESGLYMILDMHSAPGGQTGYNIDDSYGYPWLFVDVEAQNLFCDIWLKIAARYADEPTVLGYELLNEPIADYWPEYNDLNKLLEPLYIRATDAIRKVDGNHIIILGAPQWNLNFSVFKDVNFDRNIMYTCHKYDGNPGENIKTFIAFRDSVNKPMYMGETGHRPYEWQEEMCRIMDINNIGYTFWPYKMVGNECFASIVPPVGWDRVLRFAENPRISYFDIYKSRPDQDSMRIVLKQFLENIKLRNCIVNDDYIRSLRLERANN